ncbi:hypothetical protein [Lactiplantibacillus garii]|uniref:hypothetical protein n=1 Tax=Lactiplantibacillus garii TaxID=2306423 RepID=UPI001CDD8264|nr:hypothetical protein [Lactiplantibacillus garii]
MLKPPALQPGDRMAVVSLSAGTLGEETADLALPILYNVNFGYAFSRTALPYGARATVDLNAGGLTIDEPWFASTQKGGN